MYTTDALRDVHARTARSLDGFLAHCGGLAPDALARPLEGFGYPTVLQQLHHAIGAERYWIGVLNGEMLVDEEEADFASIAALRDFAARVRARTHAWLESAEDVNTPRTVITWGDKQVELAPAHVVLRTQTHVFQHLGQVAAMCRLLGRPIPSGLDFPIRDE